MIDTTGWPDVYIDDDDIEHAWTDLVPPDPDSPSYSTPGDTPWTYADLMIEIAAAQGMSVVEYLGLDDEDEDDEDADL